jgi:hypothetical protein
MDYFKPTVIIDKSVHSITSQDNSVAVLMDDPVYTMDSTIAVMGGMTDIAKPIFANVTTDKPQIVR